MSDIGSTLIEFGQLAALIGVSTARQRPRPGHLMDGGFIRRLTAGRWSVDGSGIFWLRMTLGCSIRWGCSPWTHRDSQHSSLFSSDCICVGFIGNLIAIQFDCSDWTRVVCAECSPRMNEWNVSFISQELETWSLLFFIDLPFIKRNASEEKTKYNKRPQEWKTKKKGQESSDANRGRFKDNKFADHGHS